MEREASSMTEEQSIATVLGLQPEQAAVVEGFGRLVAQHATEALTNALNQPLHMGDVTVRQIEPGELENENWMTYQPIDVSWEVEGTTYAPVTLLPKALLQTVLPAARGTTDLPDMEALGQLMRELLNHVTEALAVEFQPPVQLSLNDASATPPEGGEAQLRVEHTVAVGSPGSETELTVIHLIPAAVLQAIGTHGALVHPADSQPPFGLDAARTPAAQTLNSVESGGGVSTMDDNIAAAQPAGTSVHPVQFQPFEADSEGNAATNLDLLLDVGLRVTVELGRTDLSIKEVLALGPGSVVELDKLAGEPVDIMVNERLIAKGEVVVVDENFGVRVTDIVSPQKRIARLR